MNESVRYSAAVLDANIGSTNVTEQSKITEIVFNTFSVITELLQQHCGPYSTFAITHQVGDSVSEPTFTNDGINIVKSLSFLNPIQDFARRNIAYIGSRVESRVGDGTTTAMIMASSFMKHMADPKNHNLRKLLASVPFSELSIAYETVRNELQRLEATDVHHVDPNNKNQIRKIAYLQAFTSSHGDIELSTAIADLFAALPREAWPYIYYYREGMETETRYKVREEAAQFSSNVTIMNKNMFNDNLGTHYFRESTKLIVFPDLLTVSDVPIWNIFEKAIKDAILLETPLVVLCADNLDGYTRKVICDLLMEDVKHNVAIFFHHREHPVLNDFRILSLLTKQQDLQTKIFEVESVDVACSAHNLTINGLFEDIEELSDGKTKKAIHPFVFDMDYPQYKQQVDELKNLIDQAKEEATYRDTVSEIQSYIKIYNRLYFRRKYMIVVGGLAYDNSAAMDVLLDTVNAVNQTLEEGYTVGANVTLCEHLLQLEKRLSNKTGTRSNLCYYIVKSLLSALGDLYTGIQANTEKNSEFVEPVELLRNKRKYGYGSIRDHDAILIFNTETGWVLKDLEFALTVVSVGQETDAVMQPAALVPEVLLRIGEVCLKFLKTSNIITENGVYTPPAKKKKFIFF